MRARRHGVSRPRRTLTSSPDRGTSQYGYVSTKHLCRIEVHTSEPQERAPWVTRVILRVLGRHPRARVWHEERHVDLPTWSVRPFYRPLIRPMKYLSSRGNRKATHPPR
jgi:hypothetical protein